MKKEILKKNEEELEEDNEEEELEEEGLEEEAEKLAQRIERKLEARIGKFDMKVLDEKISMMTGRKFFAGEDYSIAGKIYGASDTKKTVDDLTKEEKIVGFFQALVRNDTVVLRALSEGVAADGGYLFPDEFKAELIRDLAEPTRMRALVRVVPMKRDILKIPKLVSGPEVRWTSENAAKIFNSLKELCTTLQQMTVNSGELLKRTILSQACQMA